MRLPRRPSLFVRFCGLSLVCFALVGIALDLVLEQQLESTFIQQEAEAVEFIAARVGPHMTDAPRFPEDARAALERLRFNDHRANDFLAMRVVAPDGTVLYAVDSDVAGTAPSPPGRLAEVMRGNAVAEVSGREGGPVLLHHAVPLRDGQRNVRAVLEVDQRYDGIQAAVVEAEKRATIVLLLGLCGLWLLLLPGVIRASRRLHRHAEALDVLAHTDDLTGLPNRRALMRRLDAMPAGATVGLAILDLDGFKAVNTLLGQAHGDEALRLSAARLRTAAGEGAVIVRLGGDEFALLAEGSDAEATRLLAERACGALAGVRIQDRPLGARAGFACAPADAPEPGLLLGRAGAALAAAKRERDDDRVRRYHPGSEEAIRALDEQRAEIQALLSDPTALTIVFQPIVGLATGDVVGYEALSRFRPGSRPPDQWFAQARAAGLGDELEATALRMALAARGRPEGTYLSLNVSPSALSSPAVQAALPTDLSGIVIEITEHELVRDFERLRPQLAELRFRGARIAVDDAGAGYAGLRQVVAVAPDIVKIDRSLIHGLTNDAARQALVEAFVRYAAHVGASVCAEGIEDVETAALLVRLDVATAQGYVFAKPSAPWVQPSEDASVACRAATEVILAGATTDGTLPSVHHITTIGDQLYAARTVEEVATLLMSIAPGVDAVEMSLSLFDAATESLRAVPVPGMDIDDGVYRVADFPATAEALRERRPLQVVAADPAGDLHERRYLEREGFGAVVLFPIAWHGRTLGVVEAYAREERPFRAANLGRMRLVAQLLAGVLARLLPEDAAAGPAGDEPPWQAVSGPATAT